MRNALHLVNLREGLQHNALVIEKGNRPALVPQPFAVAAVVRRFVFTGLAPEGGVRLDDFFYGGNFLQRLGNGFRGQGLG